MSSENQSGNKLIKTMSSENPKSLRSLLRLSTMTIKLAKNGKDIEFRLNVSSSGVAGADAIVCCSIHGGPQTNHNHTWPKPNQTKHITQIFNPVDEKAISANIWWLTIFKSISTMREFDVEEKIPGWIKYETLSGVGTLRHRWQRLHWRRRARRLPQRVHLLRPPRSGGGAFIIFSCLHASLEKTEQAFQLL